MTRATFDVFYNEVAHPDTVAILADGLGTRFRLRSLQYDSVEEELAGCRDADFVLAGWRPLTGHTIDAAPRLRAVHKLGAGVDKIDVATAARRGVQVTAAAGMNADQVAEHTIALMLGLLRRLCDGDRAVRAGHWPKNEFRPTMRDLGGSVVAVIGMGAVGVAVARRLRAFDCVLRYFDVRRRPELEQELDLTFGPIDEILRGADLVTAHVPLVPATRGLIGAAQLAQLPATALVVNTSRGGVIDEEALVDALAAQRIAGAGLDVFEAEPPPPDHPLLAMDQVLLTPHVAGSSRRNIGRLAEQARDVFDTFLRGMPPPSGITTLTPTAGKRSEPDATRR